MVQINTPQNAKKYYSQFGEDHWIVEYCKIYGISIPKLVVDIGASDGIVISNSRYFIESEGYEAILAEPRRDCKTKLDRLYAGSERVRVWNGAVSTSKEDMIAFDDTKGDFSEIDNKKGSLVPNTNFIGLLSMFGKQNAEIGILSLDVEGHELPILVEILDYCSPAFMILEANSTRERREQIALLNDRYFLLYTKDKNMLWMSERYFTEQQDNAYFPRV